MNRSILLITLFSSNLMVQLLASAPEPLPFIEPVTAPIKASPFEIELELFATMPYTSDSLPKARINHMASLPDQSGRLFICDQRGVIYDITNAKPDVYMDFASTVPELYFEAGLGTGLGFFTFHPDFAENGIFYTTHVEKTNPSELADDLPNWLREKMVDGIVTEWNAKDPSAAAFNGARREVLRISLPSFVHGLQEIAFNPNAKMGDADYGMLYICLGEAGSTIRRTPEKLRNLQSPFGCILRIDPMGTGGNLGEYGIPADNPWADSVDPEVLGEIWLMGTRNAHRLSWDSGGTKRMFFSDIGEMRVEEVNIAEPGRDYGWNISEGTFRFDPRGSRHQIFEITQEDKEKEPDITYPVAQYDHTDGFAIIGGGVYRGQKMPLLDGKYLFGDIVNGRLFFVNESELAFGSQAQVWELFLKHEGERKSMKDIVGNSRVDLRLGWDAKGELYVFEKANGHIYRAISTQKLDAVESPSDSESINHMIIQYDFELNPEHRVDGLGNHPMIDDMEDGDLFGNKEDGRDWKWDEFDDNSSGHQELEVIEVDDAPGKGTHVLHVFGGGWQHRSSGIICKVAQNIEPKDQCYYDASSYDGVRFWAKAKGIEKMQVYATTPYIEPTRTGGVCDGKAYRCYNFYEQMIDVNENWTLVTVPFDKFEQTMLPTDGPLDASILKGLAFSTGKKDDYDIWIDDFHFYSNED